MQNRMLYMHKDVQPPVLLSPAPKAGSLLITGGSPLTLCPIETWIPLDSNQIGITIQLTWSLRRDVSDTLDLSPVYHLGISPT
jgi:hypothetical protein